MCLTMNACNGNGYCQQGQCVCSKGWSGADCGQKSYFLTNFFNKKFVVNGTQSVIFEYREGLYLGERYELTLSSQQPMDVYLNALSAPTAVSIEPSEFNFVAAMKKQTFVKITSDDFPQLPTFGVQVRINGVSHYDNQYFQTAFTVKFTVYDSAGLLKSSQVLEGEQAHVTIKLLG